MTFTVQSNNGISDKITTNVVAGELNEGLVVMDADTKNLVPEPTSTIQVRVVNTDDTATSFTITAGISGGRWSGPFALEVRPGDNLSQRLRQCFDFRNAAGHQEPVGWS